MIDGIVDAEKAVVGAVEHGHGDWAVLGVVLGDVKRQLLRNSLGVYLCYNVLFAFVEECQHGVVNIIVEQDNAFLGGAYEVGNERMGIEDLAVEEDALCRLLAGFEQLENEVNALIGGNLVLLNVFNSLENGCIGNKEMSHGSERTHNLYVHFDGGL